MKPIIMSTEDVRGILDGRKTMVRIPIKHHPDKSAQFMRISCGRACFETDIDMWNMMLPCKPGDVLYVRDAWAIYDLFAIPDSLKNNPNEAWRSPVTMPRSAARLFLRVKDVRVERVQDISEKDAVAEGLSSVTVTLGKIMNTMSASYQYQKMWDARNAKRGYGWGSNPWVWVIEFERIEKERV